MFISQLIICFIHSCSSSVGINNKMITTSKVIIIWSFFTLMHAQDYVGSCFSCGSLSPVTFLIFTWSQRSQYNVKGSLIAEKCQRKNTHLCRLVRLLASLPHSFYFLTHTLTAHRAYTNNYLLTNYQIDVTMQHYHFHWLNHWLLAEKLTVYCQCHFQSVIYHV